MISPSFSLVLGAYRITQENQEDHKYQLHEEKNMFNPFSENSKTDKNFEFDLNKICTYSHNKKNYLCKLGEKEDFIALYNTFLSTGNEVRNSIINFSISDQDTKETTIIPLSNYFLDFIEQKNYLPFNECGYYIINIPLYLESKMPENGESMKYWHARFNYKPKWRKSDTRFEFYKSEKPGFSGLIFIQIIFNKNQTKSIDEYMKYNDSIINLYGYSYVKNKNHEKIKIERDKNEDLIYHENDFDEYSFPILSKYHKKIFGIENSMFKARIVKMQDLSTSFKKDDFCNKQ